MQSRNQNLDLLRAIAILMVVIFHVVQHWPTPLPRLAAVTQYGATGVDLFFILSGWLIGGLLWRERSEFGNLQIWRFMGRRALRTMPPYLVALFIYFIGAYFIRKDPFDFGYLVFIQNYYECILLFKVSWSLCIEEHFYLVIPALVTIGHLFISR